MKFICSKKGVVDLCTLFILFFLPIEEMWQIQSCTENLNMVKVGFFSSI